MSNPESSKSFNNERQIEHEFQYYTTLLKEIILWVSDPGLRKFVVDSVTTHSGSEVATSVKNREIRNKYLFRLSLAILNDTVFDLMQEGSSSLNISLVPSDFSVDYKRSFDSQKPILDKLRQDPDVYFACLLHGLVRECFFVRAPIQYSSLLRIHFWYFITMGNITYIRNPDLRGIAILWSKLISLMFVVGCSVMKEEAVTLMTGLAICTSDFEVKPPFTSAPEFPLRPLKLMKPKGYEIVTHSPASTIAEKFISSMPDIEEGAFAFISVSKELFQKDDQ